MTNSRRAHYRDNADPTTVPQQLPRRIPSALLPTTQIAAQYIYLGGGSGIHTDHLDILTTGVESAIAKLQLVRHLESAANTTAKAERLHHRRRFGSTAILTPRTTVSRAATQRQPANTSPTLPALTRTACVWTSEQASTQLSNSSRVATVGGSFAKVATGQRQQFRRRIP